MKKPVILIVEDEVAIRDMLRFALESADFVVIEAENTEHANHQLIQQIPDLILLDWMLPNQSGIEYLKQLKQKTATQDIPIIVLTARAEEDNKLQGFDAGADDYITKPFSPRELIARIKSILRRGLLASPDGIIKFADLKLNINTHQVTANGQELILTPLEYKLLLFFMKHPSKVYSRNQLLDHIWGGTNDILDRSIDVQIRRLRNRLKPYGYDKYIQTVRGGGYQWTADKL